MGLEQAGCVPQQVMANLGRTAQFVSVVAGGLDERGVQSDEALRVSAGSVAFDAADACAGPVVEPVGEVLGEERGEQHRRQHQVGGNTVVQGVQGGDEADGPRHRCGQPQ
ncbi:hypothetical protein [Streptomyces sp. S.PB5]|uniref:hypothetical protein n=1 Tax=Streptomyces sp. S.PB5 TaxID=3020844 RepID=UPI0025B1CFF2|nr:hypothetical protein [Streptomyces sp. S.PB5]MDN3028635.1 hypothetical protein [Streptomyces sp. S.PB5]